MSMDMVTGTGMGTPTVTDMERKNLRPTIIAKRSIITTRAAMSTGLRGSELNI